MTWIRTGSAALVFAAVVALVPAAHASTAREAALIVAVTPASPIVGTMTAPTVPQTAGQPFTQRLWRRSLLFAVAVAAAIIVLLASAAALAGALLRRERRRPPSRRTQP
jgi:hypothetical protein